jgi:hypothetical protein
LPILFSVDLSQLVAVVSRERVAAVKLQATKQRGALAWDQSRTDKCIAIQDTDGAIHSLYADEGVTPRSCANARMNRLRVSIYSMVVLVLCTKVPP